MVSPANQKEQKRKGKMVETHSDSDSDLKSNNEGGLINPNIHKRDDMFIFKINDTVLRFGIKEFAAVNGLKCGLLSDFISDSSIPNRLIQK
ncbi:hypothetical protein H5410_002475, partial [Solanum commersonii]